MKNLLDKLRNKITYNKKIMLFLTITVIIGIMAGSFLVVILNNNDKVLVKEYIENFINNVNGFSFNYVDTLKNALLLNLIIIISIWILGISVIGLLIVICLVFWKAFTLGFTISGFIITFNLKGVVAALVYIFPHLIINLLIIMYLGSYSIKFSMLIIKCVVSKACLDLRRLMNKYLKVLLFSTIVIIVTSLFETFITPILLKGIVSILF